MEPETVLSAATEVGIAIAGFTGIVAAISRTRAAWSPQARVYFSILLGMSVAAVAFALLPMLLSIAGTAETTVWTVSSGLYVVYVVALSMIRSIQLGRAGIRWQSGPIGVTAGTSAILVTLQLVNVAFLHEPWPHLVAVVVSLLLAFSFFIYLLSEIWEAE